MQERLVSGVGAWVLFLNGGVGADRKGRSVPVTWGSVSALHLPAGSSQLQLGLWYWDVFPCLFWAGPYPQMVFW